MIKMPQIAEQTIANESEVFSYGSTTHRRTVGQAPAVDPCSETTERRTRASLARIQGSSRWHILDSAYRGSLAGLTQRFPTVPNMPSTIPTMGTVRRIQNPSPNACGRSQESRGLGPFRMLHRWHFRGGEKRGLCVGKTKRGKGTKLMAVADRSGLPVACSVASASPHETTLVDTTIRQRFVRESPRRLIGDKAYDSDPLDQSLQAQGIDMIAPHKENRVKPPTQDGRSLRRYRRRWKVERLFAWLGNFRRILTRHDYHVQNFLGFIHFGCIIILIRYL